MFQTLVNMHQFGYKVEKEKKYTVSMKGLGNDSYLTYDETFDKWAFTEDVKASTAWSHHTREELEKAGFGWVFYCEGVEVKVAE